MSDKKSNIFSEVHQILEDCGCPYTADIDSAYLGDLLMEPGDHRLRILMWILSQIDTSAERVIGSLDKRSTTLTGTTIDKRVQVLTSLASTIGLCRAVDLDLIRGKAQASSQFTFWRMITRILKFSNKDPRGSFINDCLILNKVNAIDSCVPKQVDTVLTNLLPPNLDEEMGRTQLMRKSTNMIDHIRSELEELSKRLAADTSRLDILKGDSMYTTADDEVAAKSVARKLDLTFADLDQMITTFEQVFINSYLPYCDKEKEEFGNVGPLFEIVAKQFSYVIEVLDDLLTVTKSHGIIDRCSKDLGSAGLFASKPFLSEATKRLESLSGVLEKQKYDSEAVDLKRSPVKLITL